MQPTKSSTRTCRIGSRNRLPVLVLSGPTASGKSDILFSLFAPADGGPPFIPEAKAEVVSADSMQAYRGMDIGTAKPTPAERALLPHHLVDILSPGEQFTAGDFSRFADEAVAGIAERGGLPVVAGGTAFYLKAFIEGAPPAPPSDPLIREAVRRDLEDKGLNALRDELAAGDPESAARIHENDIYRLTRALEVLRASGKPLTYFSPSGELRSCYDFLLIALERERAELYERIDRRVDAMMERGLADEVRSLVASGFGAGSPGMKAIGYTEFLEAGVGVGIDVVADRIKQNTRRYAKRQLSFLRSMKGFEWFSADDEAGVARRVREWLAGLRA